MMWFYGHLETIVLGVFAFGIVLHFVRRRGERRRYIELRAAYEDAVREIRVDGADSASFIREVELRRALMNSWMPGWLDGFGRCVWRLARYSAGLALVLLFFRGPILEGEGRLARRQAKATATLPPPGGHGRHR